MAEVFRYLEDDADPGVKQDGVAHTTTFNSEALRLAGLDIFGILLIVTSVTGTSPTLNIKLQISEDGGTTWRDFYADAENSETQATLAAISAAKVTGKHWPCWFGGPDKSKDALDPRARFVFTIAGTSPSFTIRAFFIARSYGR